jgi:hypothetical protein
MFKTINFVNFRNREDIDYIIVINGFFHNKSIIFPNCKNIKILKRENKGFDFGGHRAALDYLEQQNKKYDYYFFMNSGVIGPILPDNFSEPHWTNVFIRKINDKVKLVGTTIVCLPATDAGGYGPRVEGFFFMVDQIGLDLLKKQGNVFYNHETFYDDIVNGEYGLSRCILENGYSIDCMLQRYNGIDWRNPENYNLNDNIHPSRKNSFYGESINPYEVIFHKWFWHNNPTVNFDIIKKYVDKHNYRNM